MTEVNGTPVEQDDVEVEGAPETPIPNGGGR